MKTFGLLLLNIIIFAYFYISLGVDLDLDSSTVCFLFQCGLAMCVFWNNIFNIRGFPGRVFNWCKECFYHIVGFKIFQEYILSDICDLFIIFPFRFIFYSGVYILQWSLVGFFIDLGLDGSIAFLLSGHLLEDIVKFIAMSLLNPIIIFVVTYSVYFKVGLMLFWAFCCFFYITLEHVIELELYKDTKNYLVIRKFFRLKGIIK